MKWAAETKCSLMLGGERSDAAVLSHIKLEINNSTGKADMKEQSVKNFCRLLNERHSLSPSASSALGIFPSMSFY